MRWLIQILFFCGLAAISAYADSGPLMLWSGSPGAPGSTASWQQEAYPVGNGKLAAMIYGGVTNEQIQFNEDTVWGGQTNSYVNPNASWTQYTNIQAKCFKRQDILTDAQNYLMSIPIRQAAYQPAGMLNLTFAHSPFSNYRRSLDLNTATVNVRYDFGGVTYNRDIFASAPSNHVIVIRFTASQTGKISFGCSFSTLQTATFSGPVGNDLVMSAKVSAIADSRYYVNGLTNKVQYEARVRLLNEGGTISTNANSISVTNADAVTLLLSVASNVKAYNDLSADPSVICSNNIASAAANTYSQLRQAQQIDYTNLFNRVVLDLGGNAQTNLSTGTRLRQATANYDPQLFTLYFQMARYLMIAGSRDGSQALNLQGKWNDATVPSWDSKMTLNINEEMNYWGAEVCNLPECTSPLFDMIKDLSASGNIVARSNYFAASTNSWVANHNTDLWRGAAAINGRDGIWPTGGAWLCQHLWWRYQYGGDTNFLAADAYPLMKGAAQFFLDTLVPHPGYAASNWWVTCPSYSPEHDWESGTTNVSNVPGPTIDNELIRDLFNHVIEASQILSVDATFRTNVMNMRAKLPPERIGASGQLQEWLEDIDGASYSDKGHRHCSHLVGFFPGDLISPFYTPVTANAAKVSVIFRGDSGTDKAWSKAWRMCLRDRMFDGDYSLMLLTNIMARYLTTNMMFTDYGNRQVDGTFGAMAGVAEMLLQSQSGEIVLLPALPTKWTNGVVSGLCARGGFEVDNLTWTNGKLAGATIVSKLGNVCRLRPKCPVDVKCGTNCVDAPMILPGLYQFSTVAGNSYTITPATVFETENLSAVTNGATQQITTNAAYNNLRGTRLNALATGNSVTYTITNLPAGNYHLFVAADTGANCGQFQLACGPIGGTLTNVGPAQDAYSPSNVVYLLGMRLTTFTNVLSTNMLKELDCGTWIAPSNGNYSFRFQVTGKNPVSSSYNLAFDYIRFSPQTVSSPIEQWRAAQFGVDTNNPAISGDAADPDNDGAPNLLEYALGKNPLSTDATNLINVVNSNYLAIVFHRAKAATDVTIFVDVKNELTDSWTTNVQSPIVTDDGNGITETVMVLDSVPMNSAPHRFMRLRVARN